MDQLILFSAMWAGIGLRVLVALGLVVALWLGVLWASY